MANDIGARNGGMKICEINHREEKKKWQRGVPSSRAEKAKGGF